MQQQPADPATEVKRLQRCVNDLVSVLALPAVWSVSEPIRILDTLLDALMGMLDLDFIYARIRLDSREAPIEALRTTQLFRTSLSREEIGQILNHRFGNDPREWPEGVLRNLGEQDVSIFPIRMGIDGEIGLIVAGSQRAGFPEQTESLVLSVASNQAAIGLQQALLLNEQKRVARELDRRVDERTKELAETNQELQLQVGLLQLLPVAAWTLKPDGTPDFVNRVWLDYSGHTLDFVRSHPEAWMTAVHPDDRETASGAFWNGVRSGQGFAMETRILCARDRTYRWHLNQAAPLRDAEGRVLKFVGTTTDIEEVKQSQENMRRTEERTGLIVDTALDAVITIDSHGTTTGWNKQAESIFGWSSSEAIGRHMSDLIIPEQQRAAHERGLRHFLATGEGPFLRRRIEVTAVRRSGVEFPVELEILPMRLGQDWLFSAFIRDITDSKRAEEKLRQSELSLRQMTETIPEMLWSASPDGAIDYCNGRFLDYTGFSPDQVMSDGWMKLLHPDDVEPAVETWKSCVKSGAPYRVEVRTFHAPGNTHRWCVTSALPLRDQEGRIVKWHGTVVDMHDWKQAQEELRNTQAELSRMMRVMTIGQLTASIAHEVNQPLSGIITNASTCLRMLKSDPPNIDGARETVQRTIRDGNRASEVVTRLRTLFGKKQIDVEPLDLNEAAREVIALLSGELEQNNVILKHELSDRLPAVHGDRVQLQQVILNLLRNGLDAMETVNDRPRQMLIRTETDGNHVTVSVQDSGVGFSPEIGKRLFEPLFTTKQEGMGIGLSVSRSIVEAHHGQLWADRNDGQGATFAFSIPQDPRNLPAPAE
jgi:PAS domain S-box-containing protein